MVQVVLYLKLITFITLLIYSECKLSPIENTFKKGVEAYTSERWSECISQLEECLHLYKLHKSLIVNCRLQCKSQPFKSVIKDDIENLKIYEHFFATRNCINSCQEKGFAGVHVDDELDDKMLFNLQTKKPYEYLHICYFQMYALPKAASAAYTYLIANPDDESMKKNLEYYMQQPEVDVNEVVDLESEDYEVLYNLGLKSYKQNNWAETVASMEEVITNYISSENICRAECERQPDQEMSPEVIITISNNIASLLHCQQQCQKKLSPLRYQSGVEFLADVLNYLQISYYHLDRIEDAAKAVATFLTLMPSDEDMLANKDMYSTLVDKTAFSERQDVIYYTRRDNYEKKLLNMFHQKDNNNIESNSI